MKNGIWHVKYTTSVICKCPYLFGDLWGLPGLPTVIPVSQIEQLQLAVAAPLVIFYHSLSEIKRTGRLSTQDIENNAVLHCQFKRWCTKSESETRFLPAGKVDNVQVRRDEATQWGSPEWRLVQFPVKWDHRLADDEQRNAPSAAHELMSPLTWSPWQQTRQ